MAVVDNWDDEDCWLTPSKEASTQSEKFDINTFLSDVKLSENAGLLSRKIAKAQQKRASRTKKMEPLTEEKLEKSISPIPLIGQPVENTTIIPFASDLHLEDWSSESDVPRRFSSTPKTLFPPHLAKSSGYWPNCSPIVSKPSNKEESESDDEGNFEDASEEFTEEVMEKISMSSSFSTIEALLNKIEDDEVNGQSLIRNPMSQSLVKVEEEEIPRHEISLDNSSRSFRSSSVSPRPLTNDVLHGNAPKGKILFEGADSQHRRLIRNGPERRSLGVSILRNSRSQSRILGVASLTPSSTLNGRQSRTLRSVKPVQPKNNVPISMSNSTTIVNDISPKLPFTLHADLATLEDLTRRQEEELRQEVLMQQQAERKTSWQGESGSLSSGNSSVTSLASSKSVDIATLKSSTPMQSASKLRPPSKLPRPTARLPSNSRTPNVGRMEKMEKRRDSADDECF